MTDDPRTYTRNYTARNHIVRETEPKGRFAMMVHARPGSRWTYCGLECTDWVRFYTADEETPDNICRTCDRAYYNDEEAD